MAQVGKVQDSSSHSQVWTQVPILRVMLAEGLGKIEFRVQGSFTIESLVGEPIHRQEAGERRWMVRTLRTQPAVSRHAVIVAAFPDARSARRLVDQLTGQGYEARVAELGPCRDVEDPSCHGKIRYRVLSGSFADMAEATDLMAHFQNAWRPRLVRERVTPPTGHVEITDAGFHVDREILGGVRLVPDEGSITTLFRLPCERWPDSPLEDRCFSGTLEFRVDNNGHLAVVNQLNVDDWLKGVLPAEGVPGFPLQAQKAVAVAMRSMALCMRGMRHVNEDWHFCAAGHCAQYSGLTHREPGCDQAVAESAGEVLLCGNDLCDAVSHVCCGGHGEHKENIWSTPAEKVLTGRPDTRLRKRRRQPLSREDQVHDWILNPPSDSNCRVTHSGHPALLERSRKGYRWKEVVSRSDLEDVVLHKTGVDLGILYEILPLRRGVSGRIIELELIGSRRNLRLHKELKIREALSMGRLSSSCFTVHADKDEDGLPQRFTISGAGQGHGCGLCQVGAGALAEAGLDSRDILAHYFPGATPRRLYPPAGGPNEMET